MKRIAGTIVMGLVLALFAGCASVPTVDSSREDTSRRDGDTRVYTVKIEQNYNDPQMQKYAINSFVKEKGFTSYDAELVSSPSRGFMGIGGSKYYTYDVTMPGSTAVEDMAKVKQQSGLDSGGFAGILLGGLGLILLIGLGIGMSGGLD